MTNGATDPILDVLRPLPTGGYVVTFRRDADLDRQMRTLIDCAGSGVRSLSAREETTAEVGEDVPAVVLEDTGIAFVGAREDAHAVCDRLQADDATEEVRPEFWLFDLQPVDDTAERTWGVAATGSETTPFTGRDISIAVLDTGLDFEHPDFAGRCVVSKSFVPDESAQDGQGHGTHCAGTAAGRRVTPGVPRYGVAPDANLVVGKVLNNEGSGRERDILASMLWAIAEGCEVISMSLGRAVRPGETFSADYERVAARALENDTLIVAAAGNESRRQIGFIAPVGAPANSPSIMAVAAIDQNFRVADFSCGAINADGGEVDIAAPGVDVFSSVPRPRLYRPLRGTSMACPHVAGLAALWAESDSCLRGAALRQHLVDAALPLDQPARDVGAGLAQAPGALVG